MRLPRQRCADRPAAVQYRTALSQTDPLLELMWWKGDSHTLGDAPLSVLRYKICRHDALYLHHPSCRHDRRHVDGPLPLIRVGTPAAADRRGLPPALHRPTGGVWGRWVSDPQPWDWFPGGLSAPRACLLHDQAAGRRRDGGARGVNRRAPVQPPPATIVEPLVLGGLGRARPHA